LNRHRAAGAFEARWGLTGMSPLDRTARRRPVTGEAEKAARRGLAETAREVLQRTVRTAAALAHDDTDFLDRLRDAGLRVRERRADDSALLGYAVALPGDRADSGTRPVWFAGSALAYDLSLPRVRERFTPHVAPADWTLAEHRIREASVLLGRAGQDEGSGDVAALGDLLAVAAEPLPGSRPYPRPGGGQRLRARRPLPGRPRPCRMAGLHPRVGARTERRSLIPRPPPRSSGQGNEAACVVCRWAGRRGCTGGLPRRGGKRAEYAGSWCTRAGARGSGVAE
ncbi:hypothetical protein ACFWWM_09975, partial [Streptomyces sp. NPDC058682]